VCVSVDNVCSYLIVLSFIEGFKEAADKFRVESGIEPCSDLSSLDNRIKVREAVLAGHIQEAIGLVNELYPELLDNNQLLYFHLQVIY
jgi:glucose-induced degradation protein 8